MCIRDRDEAIHGMLHHKTIIVPSAFMRLCTSAQKLLPTPLLMPIVDVYKRQVYKSGCVPGRGKVPFPEGQGRAEGPPA